MSAASAKYQMWGAELMRKREKENLRIQLGERFYDYKSAVSFWGGSKWKYVKQLPTVWMGKRLTLKKS